MYLGISAILFAVFFLNVLIGSMGLTPYLEVVSEMLTLLAAAVFFVLEILRREAAEKKKSE
jgi:ABC-type nickel/cobalt efflux system permease component RcnA